MASAPLIDWRITQYLLEFVYSYCRKMPSVKVVLGWDNMSRGWSVNLFTVINKNNNMTISPQLEYMKLIAILLWAYSIGHYRGILQKCPSGKVLPLSSQQKSNNIMIDNLLQNASWRWNLWALHSLLDINLVCVSRYWFLYTLHWKRSSLARHRGLGLG